MVPSLVSVGPGVLTVHVGALSLSVSLSLSLSLSLSENIVKVFRQRVHQLHLTHREPNARSTVSADTHEIQSGSHRHDDHFTAGKNSLRARRRDVLRLRHLITLRLVTGPRPVGRE